jgi:hypothetical protein
MVVQEKKQKKVLALRGGSATSMGKLSNFFNGFWPFEVAEPLP